jgi:hypothetical protein
LRTRALPAGEADAEGLGAAVPVSVAAEVYPARRLVELDAAMRGTKKFSDTVTEERLSQAGRP